MLSYVYMHYHKKSVQDIFDDIGVDAFSHLRNASGYKHQDFLSAFVPSLERFVLLVQEAPLGRALFDQRGGAVLYAMNCALMALRICDGVIFAPNASSQNRMILEPQYRYAAFCASLSISLLLINHEVLFKVQDSVWSPVCGNYLYDAAGNSGYEVSWKPETEQRPSAMLAVAVLPLLFKVGQFAHLKDEVLANLCDAINPSLIQKPAESPLARTVREAHVKVHEIEEKKARLRFSPSDRAAEAPGATQHETTAVSPAPHKTTSEVTSPQFGRSEEKSGVAISDGDVLAWVKVVSKSLPHEIKILTDGVSISRAALNYGIGANVMYQKIHAAGLVQKKMETGILGNQTLSLAFQKFIGSEN